MAIPDTKNAAMSIAEQLRAEGRAEGRSLGLWVGKIQVLQDLMGLKVTPHDDLAKLGNAKLEEVFNELHRQYNVRFKS